MSSTNATGHSGRAEADYAHTLSEITLTTEQAKYFRDAWTGQLQADTESSVLEGFVDQIVCRDGLADYINLLQARADVLDRLGWTDDGAPTVDVTISVRRDLVDQVVTSMLEPGHMATLTREDLARAEVAFAIEDQISEADRDG